MITRLNAGDVHPVSLTETIDAEFRPTANNSEFARKRKRRKVQAIAIAMR
jgi:hypothetical protein